MERGRAKSAVRGSIGSCVAGLAAILTWVCAAAAPAGRAWTLPRSFTPRVALQFGA